MRNIALKNLSIAELQNMQKHLRLGLPHLKTYLTPAQFSELLNNIKLNSAQHNYLRPSGSEKSGSFSLVVNTLITGFFGAWLGMASFLEIGLGSKLTLLTVTIISTLVSGILGYYNFELTKKQGYEAIVKQKLLTMQRQILHIIIKKRYQLIHKNTHYLWRKLLNLVPEIIEQPQEFSQKNMRYLPMAFWAHKIIKSIQIMLNKLPEYSFFTLCEHKLLSIKSSLQKYTYKNQILTSPPTFKSGIEALTQPVAMNSKLDLTPGAWWQHNFPYLIVSFLPAIFGAFGSMFVYLDGLPKLTQTFRIFQNINLYKTPMVKMIALFLAIILTLYLGYAAFQTNRKSYLRSRILGKTQQKIIKLELRLSKTNKKFFLLKTLRNKIKDVEFIYYLIKKISHHPSEFEKLT